MTLLRIIVGWAITGAGFFGLVWVTSDIDAPEGMKGGLLFIVGFVVALAGLAVMSA